jgi:hypothetical protein
VTTFAEDAEQGIYYDFRCLKCRRQTSVSARRMSDMEHGDRQVVGIQQRMKCKSCGNRGATLTLHGHWTGPEWSRPMDWAETVESRMPLDRT